MSLHLYTGRKRNFYFGGLTQTSKRNWLKLLTHNSGTGILVSQSGAQVKPANAPESGIGGLASGAVKSEKVEAKMEEKEEKNEPEVVK